MSKIFDLQDFEISKSRPGPSSKRSRKSTSAPKRSSIVKSENPEVEVEIDLSHLGSDPLSEGLGEHFLEDLNDSEDRPLKPACPVAPRNKSNEVRGSRSNYFYLKVSQPIILLQVRNCVKVGSKLKDGQETKLSKQL